MKTRKPLLIVIGIVLVALAGVIYWAATRPEPDPVTKTVTDPAEEARRKKAEEEREQARAEARRTAAEAAAAMAYSALELRDARLGDTITLEKKAEWIALSTDLDKFVAENPDATTSGAKAKERASAIRVEIERLETVRDTVEKAAKDWWSKAETQIKAASGNDKWGDAIRGAEAVLAGEDWKKNKDWTPPEAEKWLREVPDESYRFAVDASTQTYSQAEAAFKDGDVLKALKLVEEWEKKVRAQGLTEPRWTLLADQAKQWRDAKAEAAQAQLQEHLLADKKLFVESWRKVRHWGVADDGGGPVFNYRFADAARDLRAANEGRLKTWLYRERADGVAARLDAAQAAWDGFCKAVAEKRIWAAGDDIKGFPNQDKGAKVTLDPDRVATNAELYVIVSVGVGTKKTTLQWDDLTPEDLYKVFIGPRIDKLPPELALQLAHMFGLLARQDAAGFLLDRAHATAEQSAWLMGEIAAMQEYDRIVQGVGMQPTDQIHYIDQWRKAHFRTDFSILADGRGPEDMRHLFADEDIERFVDAYGEKAK